MAEPKDMLEIARSVVRDFTRIMTGPEKERWDEHDFSVPLTAMVLVVLERVAAEARAEEREACCRAMCPMCDEGNPHEAHLCRAAKIRARGGRDDGE